MDAASYPSPERCLLAVTGDSEGGVLGGWKAWPAHWRGVLLSEPFSIASTCEVHPR